ncbi:MAG: prepilin-type N-terminal cleavage/methylation domain-containing protein [Planctomycetota bacterium]
MIHAPRPSRPARATPGFSLVELTIVVLILSILAAMVIPKISSGTDESRTSATAATVKSVNTMIQYEINDPDNGGAIPATVDPGWFANNQLPVHPWDESYSGTRVEIDATATAQQTHPTFKTFRGTGVFWYNPRNGRFRALIPDQGDANANLDLYNAVNASAITAWDQTTGG